MPLLKMLILLSPEPHKRKITLSKPLLEVSRHNGQFWHATITAVPLEIQPVC